MNTRQELSTTAIARDQAVAVLSVGVVAQNHFHQVLMVERCDGRVHIPSGKVKPLELAHKAAEREFSEETGLTIELNEAFPRTISMVGEYGVLSIGYIYSIIVDFPENWTTPVSDEDIKRVSALSVGEIVTAYNNKMIYKPEMTMRALYPYIEYEYQGPFEGLNYLGHQPPDWLNKYADRN